MPVPSGLGFGEQKSGSGRELGHQLFLARREEVAHGHQIEALGCSCLDEHFVALFLDVVIDVFAQNLDFGVEHVVDLGGILDLGDQVLGACMLVLGLVEQVGLLQGFAQRGIARSVCAL